MPRFCSATCTKSGQGAHQDYQAAMDWYMKAAEQRHSVGQSRVGALYETGFSVAGDYSTVMNWYLKVAEQEDLTSQIRIGFMYRLWKKCA
jgi:TPR repeat protein